MSKSVQRIIQGLREETEREFEETTLREIKANEEENLKTEIISRNSVLKQKVANLFLTGGYTMKQIGEILNISPATVSRTLKSEEVQNWIMEAQMAEDNIMQQSLKALRQTAIEKQRELIMNSENEMVSAMMIKDVLDRTGHKPVEKREIQMNHSFEENLEKLVDGIELTVDEDGIYTVETDD